LWLIRQVNSNQEFVIWQKVLNKYPKPFWPSSNLSYLEHLQTDLNMKIKTYNNHSNLKQQAIALKNRLLNRTLFRFWRRNGV